MSDTEVEADDGDHAEFRDDENLLRFCHDLRQQVATGRLLAGMCQSPPDSDAGSARDLSSCIDALAQILEDLEAMIAGQLGEVSGLWEADLEPIVQRSARQAQLAHGRGVALTSDGPAWVHCDPVKMRRAVGNVLDNALRACQVGGEVHVELRSQDDEVVLVVSDEGPGFARIGSVTGFGMTIVSETVREAHGSLHISSGPAPGTTVELRFPRLVGQASA